jgi:hypothetical protein
MKKSPSIGMDEQSDSANHLVAIKLLPVEGPIISYSASISRVELRHSWAYFAHKCVIAFTLLSSVASSSILRPETDSIAPVSFIQTTVAIASGYPIFFDPTSDSLMNLILILLLLIILTLLNIGIAFRSVNGSTASFNLVKLWILAHRVILPLITQAIGANFGFFFAQLTKTTACFNHLLISIACITLWTWLMISSVTTYSGSPYIRTTDLSQIRPHFFGFEIFIAFLPMVYSALPPLLDILVDSLLVRSSIFCAGTLIVDMASAVFVMYNCPYIEQRMNSFVALILLEAVPVSTFWLFGQVWPNRIVVYFLICVSVGLIGRPFTTFCLRSADFAENLPILETETHVPPEPRAWPHNIFSFEVQDIVIWGYLIVATLGMMLSNAVAARRMPIANALQDSTHELFHTAEEFRGADGFGSSQLSNIAVLVIAIWLSASLFVIPEIINVRRSIFVYSTLSLLRSVSFLVTSLPAPCAGLPKCPCADPKVICDLKSTNALKMALSWIFGMGIWPIYAQCGDLIVSGHTQFLWLGMRCIQECNKFVFREPISSLLNIGLTGFIGSSLVYIVIVRNHYSVDVWFGLILSELLWLAYLLAQGEANRPPSPSDVWPARLVRWIERRQHRHLGS